MVTKWHHTNVITLNKLTLAQLWSYLPLWHKLLKYPWAKNPNDNSADFEEAYWSRDALQRRKERFWWKKKKLCLMWTQTSSENTTKKRVKRKDGRAYWNATKSFETKTFIPLPVAFDESVDEGPCACSIMRVPVGDGPVGGISLCTSSHKAQADVLAPRRGMETDYVLRLPNTASWWEARWYPTISGNTSAPPPHTPLTGLSVWGIIEPWGTVVGFLS